MGISLGVARLIFRSLGRLISNECGLKIISKPLNDEGLIQMIFLIASNMQKKSHLNVLLLC